MKPEVSLVQCLQIARWSIVKSQNTENPDEKTNEKKKIWVKN